MPTLYNSQFKKYDIKTQFLVFLNRDANTEEETLTVDENLGIRT